MWESGSLASREPGPFAARSTFRDAIGAGSQPLGDDRVSTLRVRSSGPSAFDALVGSMPVVPPVTNYAVSARASSAATAFRFIAGRSMTGFEMSAGVVRCGPAPRAKRASLYTLTVVGA